jgi:membrane protein YdbS with pleckstrin-like domain
MRIFRAAPAYFQYRLAVWGIRQVTGGIGLVVGIGFLQALPAMDPGVLTLLRVLEGLAILSFVAQIFLSLALVHLDYRFRWYLVTDRSLRIREGTLSVREQTMTFSNIQNMTVLQGPIQRLLGIQDLQVRTAGGGGEGPGNAKQGEPGAHDMHLAYFRGVFDAAAIRDGILERLKGSRGSGLGDPDDDRHAPRGESWAPALEAAGHLLEEARALREQVQTHRPFPGPPR